MRFMVPLHEIYGSFLRRRQWLVLLVVTLLTFALAPVLPVRAQTVAPIRLLALGDSLTAGYNLPADAAYPAQLEQALRAGGLGVTVINAGVSGDTTAGALSRLDWALADKPSHALVALGANDMLRGLSPENAQANLEKIIAKLQQAGVKVMLAGMLAAPNLGEDYGRRFNAIYPALAAKYKTPLYPFFLDGVATQRSLTLDDGMHPNRAGVAEMVRRSSPSVAAWLKGQ